MKTAPGIEAPMRAVREPGAGNERVWHRWQDRWLSLRDRWLSSPRFQRRASGFFLTRGIARSNARQVFDLVAGFVYSQVLLACVRLEVFDLLARGPASVAALAPQLALSESATLRLLAAAASLRLVERRSRGRFGLGPLGAPLVGNVALRSMIEHHAALYGDLADPVALLRADGDRVSLAGYWPYAGAEQPARLSNERVAAYSALMSASQPLVADEVLDAYSLSRHRCLLDVGGGEGRFLVSAARRHPALRLMLFDLPAVAERARARFADEGLADRAQCIGGSFFDEELPQGADALSLVRVIHDHDDAQASALLRAAFRALPPGGALLLAEPMAGTAGAEPMGDAYFGFYLLAMGSGRPRTVDELFGLLTQAGFVGVRQLSTRLPLQTSVLVAHVPAMAQRVNPQ